MIPVQHIDPEDLPLYAMQLLPPEEAEAMSLQLQHSVEARRVLADIYGELAALALTAEMHAPPAETRDRLMKQVGREKKALPAPPSNLVEFTPRARPAFEEPPARSAAASILPWLGWAAAACLAVQTGLLTQNRHRLERDMEAQHAELAQSLRDEARDARVLETLRSPDTKNVVLTATEGRQPPQGRVSYNAGKGSLVFVASNLEPLQAYKTYELWLLPSDGTAPVPAGTFRPDIHGDASVVLPQLPAGTAAKGFGVTVEDGDGSPVPTSPILLKGLAT